MNIFFVYPDILNYALFKGTFYTGIASLSATLKRDTSWKPSLLHVIKPITKEEFIHKLSEANPDLVAFSATTNMYPYVEKWAKWVKEYRKDIFNICGGLHSTISPEEVISNPNIDIVCIGEGEISLIELCNKLANKQNITAIKSLWVKDKTGKVYKNSLLSLIQDLDTLPFVDRTIFDYQNLHSESEGRATVMISRGCPYRCTYCCNEALKNIYASGGGKYVRFRSVHSAISELKQVKETYKFIKTFAFDDDILPLDKKWFREFALQYRKEIGLPYDCNLRPNLVDKEIVSLLKNSGCYQVRMGIESGSDYIRNKILNRNISEQHLIDAFGLCKKADIKIHSFNMIGLPYEDLKMMLDTVKLNAKLDTDINQVTIFYPYKKTPLYDICLKKNLIDSKKEILDYTRDTALKFGRAKRNRIIFIQRYFRVLVKVYKNIERLPGEVGNFTKNAFECIVFGWLSSILALPIFNNLLVLVWKNKILSRVARKINRKFLKG